MTIDPGHSLAREQSTIPPQIVQARHFICQRHSCRTAPAMIRLSDAHRAVLIAFVKASSRMPADARERILKTLEGDEVPASMSERPEGRMGG